MKKFLFAVTFITLLAAPSARAQNDSAATEELRLLRKKVEELERKIELMEQGRGAPPTNQPSDALVQELDQKVRVLERNRELEVEAAEAKAKQAPTLTIGEKGFAFASADTNFLFQLKGVLQVDSRTFFGDDIAGNDGFLLRRARPIFQGTVFRDFDFMFVPDFGGSGSPQIFDAYINYKYSQALQLQAGKFKTPFGLEQLQSDKDVLFNERSLVTDLVPNRDLGIMLQGNLWDGTLNYAAAILNGVADGRNSSNVDIEDDKAFAGRIFAHPFKRTSIDLLKGFGIGLAGTYESLQGTNVAALANGYATVGQQTFFAYNPTNRSVVASGDHWRISPQAYWYYGPFSLMGEYAISEQGVALGGRGDPVSTDLQHHGWQVSGGWVLTGEPASFTGVVPRRNFNPRAGAWGALQLVARYSELKIDDDAFPLYANPATSASSASEWSVGLNWYLNRNVRVGTSFSHTDFSGGGGTGTSAPAAVTRQSENVLFTRIQLAF